MNNYDDKSKEELISLLDYYKSEYVLICSLYKNEKKEHRNTKNQLKLFKDRSRELAQKYYDLRELGNKCQ